MTLVRSVGTLRYSIGNTGHKLILEIDAGIQLFYRSLIPKCYPTNSPRAEPHITIIRKWKPRRLKHWGKYEGQRVAFFYDTEVENDETYWWLNCYSKELERIAEELGMPLGNYRDQKALAGFRKIWHTTIANTKGIE